MSNSTIETTLSSQDQERDHLLSNENYEKLRSMQREIESETQVIPTFKKIINLLFKDDVLDDVKSELVERLK